jgi:hypothetical protein
VDHFEKLLEAICPNHMYPVRHKLKECTMIKNNMTTQTFARRKKPKGDSAGKAVMSIYDGPTPSVNTLLLWLIALGARSAGVDDVLKVKLTVQNSNKSMLSLLIICSSIYTYLCNHWEEVIRSDQTI